MVAVTPDVSVEELTEEEGAALVADRVRHRLNIDVDTFVQRWRSGYYGDVDDDPEALELAVLLPIIGIDPWSDGQE